MHWRKWFEWIPAHKDIEENNSSRIFLDLSKTSPPEIEQFSMGEHEFELDADERI